MSEVAKALQTVKQNICQTAKLFGRAENSVRLVAVSKTKPVEMLKECFDAGQEHFGENYIQEICEKAPLLPKEIKWHFIGHLQSNKVKQLVEKVESLYMVETVDRVKIAQALEKTWSNTGRDRKLNVLVQVNTSNEESKSGISTIRECEEVIRYILEQCPHLNLRGLMTIGSYEHSQDPERNPDFEKLVQFKTELFEKMAELAQINPFELSMGMSHDYEVAIKYGSTNVRVGSAIFGARTQTPNSTANQ
ncbi:hypothetical protein C9374_006690 [Naegleria lovaniensis]|uniref:Pyridoxal phosphate homeostasis protein n=1 Tax=Naegleria lovaniensis TaxID=51637 RepID=A0AA88KJ42_NAELO|nr:uncharacterized protein C9374_006690 [Naegleria lovaniensis]KAG2379573.1 hypothetical protein C9374_006690 [Naegleria lovaniensis]